ncbi:hypothetical protein MITS9508_02447 [Synechococcus sp. MIT S9508]|nr:hypothetical protein MITS9508_02447 [Synechococcus sp. MIT S9508]
MKSPEQVLHHKQAVIDYAIASCIEANEAWETMQKSGGGSVASPSGDI